MDRSSRTTGKNEEDYSQAQSTRIFNKLNLTKVYEHPTYRNYRIALEVSQEPDRILYLAVPTDTYEMFLKFEPAKTVFERYEVRLIIYKPNQEVIDRWIE